jgi:DNA processing protein
MKKSFDLFTLTKNQTNFPSQLKNIYNCPEKIWCQGNKSLLNNHKSLAVVGSRKISWYGHLAIDSLLTKELVNQLVIISGLAIGVDRLAHQVCLEQGGQTIAVLGSGLDQSSLYPPSNWLLAQKIVKSGGLLLSEHPPGEQARSYYFPQRNRIIAGLASAVLIIEAANRSGALITADLASQEGRDVLVVPGNINQPMSKGANQLIKSGAELITEVDDLLTALDLPKSNSYSELS